MAVKVYPLPNDDQLDIQSALNRIVTVDHPVFQQNCQTNAIDELPLLLSVSDVSEILGIGRNSTYKLIHSGRLKSIRIGKLIKVPRAALESYLQSY